MSDLSGFWIDAAAIEVGSHAQLFINDALYVLLIRVRELFWDLQGFIPVGSPPVKRGTIVVERCPLLHEEKWVLLEQFCPC